LQIKIICWLIFISLRLTVAGQSKQEQLSFSEVDSFVLTVKYRDDYIQLAKELTRPFYDDILKVRAIFKWITNNIEYDYRFVNSGREISEPACNSEIDCALVLQEWEHRYIRKILRNKKAIADGYSRLFKVLCDYSYIQSEVITGYARTKPYQVGNNMGVNHSWNAVLIDTAWFYLDATWAAGYCIEDEESGRLLRFVKDYQNYYWLKPFDIFSRNHFPKKGMFVENTSLTKDQFFNKPFFYSPEILENLTEIIPQTGVLKVKKGDTLFFAFEYRKEIKWLQVNSNIFRNPPLWVKQQVSKKKSILVKDAWAEKKQQYIPFTRNGNIYRFYYVVREMSLYYLELAFDYKPAIRYRIRFEN
jgi:hypothetical protein